MYIVKCILEFNKVNERFKKDLEQRSKFLYAFSKKFSYCVFSIIRVI